MLLDRTGKLVDGWVKIEETEEIPWHGPIIVPFSRLEEALKVRAATGVAVPNDTDPMALKAHLPRLGLIAISFPNFADGRGFSIAKRLRDLGYDGRLRAEGPVIADQFAYLLECGFDEVAVPEALAARQPVQQWLAQISKVNLRYQRGRTGRQSILDQRLGRGA